MLDLTPMVLAGMVWLFYRFWISAYNRWQRRGIPFIAGSFPFGSDPNLSTLRRYQGYVLDDMYKRTTLHQYFGIYVMRTNMLVIRDPEIVKMVLDSEFTHFMDRMPIKVSGKDVSGHHLYHLGGNDWKTLRDTITPAFTSEKLKAIFPLFLTCAEKFNTILQTKLESDVNVKDVTACFTTHTICKCTFGLEDKTLIEHNQELVKIGNNYFEVNLSSLFKNALRTSLPIINNIFPVRFASKNVEKYLVNLVGDTIQFREKNNIKKDDLLDLLMHLENHNTKLPLKTDRVFLTAQCFGFFLTSYQTSSSLQSYCLYELALNQDIQEKLRKEICFFIKKHGGLTYEAVEEMEYLEMVLSETMRKYPVIPFLMRTCTKNFTFPAGHIIEKGETILIPVWSLHHDKQYFPKPEIFNPERFSATNKNMIKPFTYLPFGDGPRQCIGMSFGLLLTKIGLITILKKFQVVTCEKTAIPLEFIASTSVPSVNGPIILKLLNKFL